MITGDTGVSKIIEQIDKIYIQDTLIKQYEALDNFENYKRPPDVSVSEYILEFDKRYLKTKNLGTQMSDDLLAYRLLRNANLGDQYTKLVKATSKLEYEVMKQQLKNLFTDASSSSGDFEPLIPASGSMRIKEEVETFFAHHDSSDHDTLYTSSKNPNWKKPSYDAHNSASCSKPPGDQSPRSNSGKKSKSSQKKSSGASRRNPLNSDGEVTRCHYCQSIYHYQPECPDKARNKDKDLEDTLFSSEVVLCEDGLEWSE